MNGGSRSPSACRTSWMRPPRSRACASSDAPVIQKNATTIRVSSATTPDAASPRGTRRRSSHATIGSRPTATTSATTTSISSCQRCSHSQTRTTAPMTRAIDKILMSTVVRRGSATARIRASPAPAPWSSWHDEPGVATPIMSRLTRALRHRNYRLFFTGQSLSLVGTWITRVATSWLVYRLTGSELLLGIVGFFGQIPTMLLAPFAGVLVDRTDRHRLLVVTQVLSLLQSLALALLTLNHLITVKWVLGLQVVQGVINAFDTPARQSFVVEMVEDRADLANAIALNSSMVNGSRIIGPSVGGLLIAAFGEGWCFVVDGISYLFVIASLLLMRVRRSAVERVEAKVLAELRTGFHYVAHSPPIRTALIVLSIVSAMAMPYTVLMPALVANVLRGGPNTLGLLMTASGVGAL